MTTDIAALHPGWPNATRRFATAALAVSVSPILFVATASATPPDLATLASGVEVHAVAMDGDNMYLTENATHQVIRVDLESGISTIILGNTNGSSGSGPNELNRPRGLALDGDDLYIADGLNNRIQKLDLETSAVETFAGGSQGSGSNQLNGPAGIDISGNHLYIVDTFNHRVQRVELTGGSPTTVIVGGGTPFSSNGILLLPYAVAVSGDTLFVADTGHHLIHSLDLVTPGAVPVPILGTGSSGGGDDELSSPAGVASHNGLLYVGDRVNSRIQQLNLSTGEVRTIAGTGASGPAAHELDRQRNLNIVGDQLLIADTGNGRVRSLKIDTTKPTIQTSQGSIRVGTEHSFSFDCSDDSAPATTTCIASLNGAAVSSGTPIDTSRRGTQTLTITATDYQGNTSTESFVVTVHGKREVTNSYASTTGDSGLIARLYMASFIRDSDVVGHAYWQARLNDGDAAIVLAEYFISGPEFRSPHGQMSNGDFVELMYNNALARASEQEGKAYWTARLDSGLSRARMLLLFADSPECRQITFTN